MEDDSLRIADAAHLRWQAVGEALAPVIGSRGVAAIFARSLYLGQADHPWLAKAADPLQGADDFAALRTTLLQQAPLLAAAADAALMVSFFDLLCSLIGPALTETLIGFAHPLSPGGSTAQDPSP